jgi:putative ABC transport system ATP-binding protein
MINNADILLSINQLGSGLETKNGMLLTKAINFGEHLAISGSSGCGKTSLLMVLAGLKEPNSGSFSWQGQPVLVNRLTWWRQQFCYLPQQPVMGAETISQVLRLPWTLNAIRNVPSPSSEIQQLNQNVATEPSEQACIQALRQVGLKQSLDTDVSLLSGGEKQRTAIARAVLMQRPLWLLDEPTSALDGASRDTIIALLARLAPTRISVSHDPVWLASSDHQYHMESNNG